MHVMLCLGLLQVVHYFYFVSAPLRMTRTLSSVSANIDDEAEFMCEANGVPAPEFRWLLNGSEHTNGVTTTSEIRVSTVEVRSTLVLPSVMERHTGTVTCVAFHDRHGETALVTSSANLVVLSELIKYVCNCTATILYTPCNEILSQWFYSPPFNWMASLNKESAHNHSKVAFLRSGLA